MQQFLIIPFPFSHLTSLCCAYMNATILLAVLLSPTCKEIGSKNKRKSSAAMNWRTPTLLTFLLFLLFPLAASLDIARLLGKFPQFSTFRSLLLRTDLVPAINSRNTLTVLAIDNNTARSVASRSLEELQNILAVHVLLDYFDVAKIHEVDPRPFVTTLFQATGIADSNAGFVYIIVSPAGDISFVSAEKSSPPVAADLVKEITKRPYNISVLQVSTVIVPPSLGPPAIPLPPSDEASPSDAPSPSKTPSESGGAGSPDEAPAPAPAGISGPSPSGAEGPAGDEGPPGEAPAGETSTADAPAPGAPEASSPAEESADGTTANNDEAEYEDTSAGPRRLVEGAAAAAAAAGAVAFAVLLAFV